MQIQSYKAYTPDSILALPLSRVIPRMIGSLDGFLSAIQQHYPQLLDDAASKLLSQTSVRLMPSTEFFPSAFEQAILTRCKLAARFHDLFVTQVQWLWQLSGVSPSDWMSDEIVALSQVRFIKMRYLPNYVRIKILVELMGRESAIEWMKQYLDGAIRHAPPQPNAPKSLTDLRDRQIEFNLQEKGMDWVTAVISEHQYLNKVTTCRIQKVLAQYEDDALMEIVACYPDFAMFRKTNESFHLTRTQTLMNGGCCCDTCYHDVRYVQDFEHPPLDVFASLER